MINARKGTAHSLAQADIVGTIVAGQGVVAGMVCRLHTDGTILKGNASATTIQDTLLGFAINNQDDGDVIESGKLGLYSLDGNSVIETDQTAATITAGNYPIGTALTAQTDGLVADGTPASDRIIGWVYGIRSLPCETTLSNGDKIQSTKNLLAIKLA